MFIKRIELLYSSNILFKIIKIVYNIFNLCLSKYDVKFTKSTYEKNGKSDNSVTYTGFEKNRSFFINQKNLIFLIYIDLFDFNANNIYIVK